MIAVPISEEYKSWSMSRILAKVTKSQIVLSSLMHCLEACPKGALPKPNPAFFPKKLEDSVERDARKKPELIESGWQMVAIWECELAKEAVSLVEDFCMQSRGGRDG